MINAIIEAISISLNAEFGEDYEIHMEEIKQGLVEPCFFISGLEPSAKLFLGKRYLKTNHFCIQYFPQSQQIQRECNDIAERMIWCLEYIGLNGDLIRGTDMKYSIDDGILNFFVNYDFFIYRNEKQEAVMSDVKSDTTVKKEGN